MNIFETLRLEHTAAETILDEIIEKTDPEMCGHSQEAEVGHKTERTPRETRLDLLAELKVALIAHDRAEEAIVYEALRNLSHHKELADLKTEEHLLVEEIIEELERTDPDTRAWERRLRLLKSQLDAHVAEEETNVFAILQPYISDEEGERMTVEFEALRDEITAQLEFHADRTILAMQEREARQQR